MTKKQIEKSYQTVLNDRQGMLHIFGEIRDAIGMEYKEGIAPEAVLNGVQRLIKIGNLTPFTFTQLQEWGESIWQEMLDKDTEIVESP